MAKIDRLGWAAGICVRCYGLNIGIRVNSDDAAILERIKGCLPPVWEPAEPPFVDYLFSLGVGSTRGNVRYYHMLHAGLRRAARCLDLDELFITLEDELALYVAEWAKDRVFVHAGVVGWQGRALVLPGRSRAGKSTLVRALLAAGAHYYSDEFAVLDGAGRVHPYARKLSLRQPDGQPVERLSAEELGAPVGKEPLPVGLVALLRYRDGLHGELRKLPAGKGILEVLDHTVPARSRPELALPVLGRLAPGAPHVKGLRGDADETARFLLRSLQSC
jgi:hypothetical protein